MHRSTSSRIKFACLCIAVALVALHLNFTWMQPAPYDLQVYGQQQLTPGATATVRAVLLDQPTAAPLAGERVAIRLLDKKGDASVNLGSFITNAEGSSDLAFELPTWPQGRYIMAVETEGLVSRQRLELPVELKQTFTTTLATDRPVYQPGQTVHVRALMLRQADGRPAANQAAWITLNDPRDNVIFKQQVTTSKFGLASVDCELATEMIEGRYIVRSEVEGNTHDMPIEIKRYVLPKFSVTVNTDRLYYQLGQPVGGTFEARYFFGKPVAGASVQFQIREGDRAVPGASTGVKTDADGRASFSINIAQAFPLREGDLSTFELHVEATDATGATVERRLPLVLTDQPFRVEVVPESDRLLPGVENVIYLIGRDALKQPVPFTAAVGGIEGELKSSALGVLPIRLTCEADQMVLNLTARDGKGNTHSVAQRLSVDHRADAFVMRTDRARLKSGQPIELTVIGQGDQPVLVDVLRQGTTVLTHSVPMRDGRGAGILSLPEKLRGPLDLVAYRVGSQERICRQVRRIHVEDDASLNITATKDRDTYRPGERAHWALLLTDHSGRPVVGALSLAMVDEAALALGAAQSDIQTANKTTAINDEAQREFELAMVSLAADSRGNRQAILQRLIDEEYLTEEYLDVLDDPDRDELLAEMHLDDYPQVVRDVLFEREPAVHSMGGSTYPAQAAQVEAHREAALAVVHTLMIIFCAAVGVFFVGLLIVWMAAHSRALLAVLAVVLAAVLLVGLLLPSLGAARRTARRMQNGSQLRGIAMAIEMLHDSDPLLGAKTNVGSNVRVRNHFPETLLWRPQLITDEHGRATLDLNLADSITTWQLRADAITLEGRRAQTTEPLRVFQPFFVDVNLPATLTRGDAITLPVMVYNYLPTAQDVALTVEPAPWFALDETVDVTLVSLQANEVRTVHVPIRVLKIGRHEFQVTAQGIEMSDAIRRTIVVMPEGVRVDRVASGTLEGATTIAMHVPDRAIDGSARALLRLYPSAFTQVLEGLDAIVGRPHGCFEQSSSSTYPNLLVLDYLQRTKTEAPALEANAKRFVHLGYQQLLAFEVGGGGFEWFGHPPANRILTAYGLTEFADMAKVYPVDPKLIERTRQWLLRQRRDDGSWNPESYGMEDGPRAANASDERLIATAYIAWSLGSASTDPAVMHRTRQYLLHSKPIDIDDAYTLAMVCNALLALDANAADVRPYLDRLNTLAKHSRDRKMRWWTRSNGRDTAFHGGGRTAAIETTALAVLALTEAAHPSTEYQPALRWLVAQKDPQGGWHATQSTVLALKALLAGTQSKPKSGPRQFKVHLDGQLVKQLDVPADQHDVMQVIDLSSYVVRGDSTIAVEEQSDANCTYQLAWRYHLPNVASQGDALSIQTTWPVDAVPVGRRVRVKSLIANRSNRDAPMPVAHLPIPAGCELDVDSVRRLVSLKTIAKYEVKPGELIVYLRRLNPESSVVFDYELTAVVPAEVAVPASKVYLYYNPAQRAVAPGGRLIIRARMD